MGNRYEFRIEPFKPKYAVSMSAVLLNKNLPKYVMVFDGKTAARIAQYFS